MRRYLTPDPTEGGGPTKPPPPDAPKDFKPLTTGQRTDWNRFLDYLDANKVGGSTDLDKKDQSLGLTYLNKYRSLNPKTSITPEMIPNIQYDQYLLRKGDSYPTLSPDELKYVRAGLNPAYMARPVSPIDGWLGSVTSKLYYPTATRGTNTGESYNFGTSFEDYAKSAKDPELQKKYLVKTQQ